MISLGLNCTYYIIYSDIRDSSSLIPLNKQIYRSELKFLLLVYNQSTNKPYGYNLLDLNQNTPEDFHVATDIFTVKVPYM